MNTVATPAASKQHGVVAGVVVPVAVDLLAGLGGATPMRRACRGCRRPPSPCRRCRRSRRQEQQALDNLLTGQVARAQDQERQARQGVAVLGGRAQRVARRRDIVRLAADQATLAGRGETVASMFKPFLASHQALVGRHPPLGLLGRVVQRDPRRCRWPCRSSHRGPRSCSSPRWTAGPPTCWRSYRSAPGPRHRPRPRAVRPP